MTQHTPTPWRVDSQQNIVDMQDRVIVPLVQGHDVLDPMYAAGSKQLIAKDDGGKANAELICRTVNGFENLLIRVEHIELLCDGLIRIIEEAGLRETHRGYLANAQHILLNDPMMFTPAGGDSA